MIPLDDTIWKELSTAYGNGTAVADALSEARAAVMGHQATIEEIFVERIWQAVCHQGTPYSAIFAAIPHLVDIAGTLPPCARARAAILSVLGYGLVHTRLSVTSIGNIGDLDPARFDCRDALRQAALLIAETILCDREDTFTDDVVAHLFATLAAIKGNADLYFAMWGLFDNIGQNSNRAPK